MFSNFDLRTFIVGLMVVIISISLHEFGHAISADYLGDDTPRRQGRITLWPDKHFDTVGLILVIVSSLVGFGIGYGKPVMVDPGRLKHPNRDMIIIAAFGPLMNLLLAIVFGLVLRIAYTTHNVNWLYDSETGTISLAGLFVVTFLMRNLSLMFFNLLPIYPLDGSKILYGLLPARAAISYNAFMSQYGMLILMVLVMAGGQFLGTVIGPAVITTANVIIGTDQLFGH